MINKPEIGFGVHAQAAKQSETVVVHNLSKSADKNKKKEVVSISMSLEELTKIKDG